MSVITLPPSGDTTGATDTRAIQDAIDELQREDGYGIFGALELCGHYRVNRTVGNGDEIGQTVNPVAILGRPFALLDYVGDPMDDYVLRTFGERKLASKHYGRASLRMANLSINCNWKCRGAMVTGQWQFPRYEGIRVFRPVGVGLDVIGCQTSAWSNIHVYYPKGYAARFAGFNSASLSNFRVAMAWVARHRDYEKYEDTPQNVALQDYAMLHGMEAAQQHYRDKLLTFWPADDDPIARDATGKPYNMETANGTLDHALVVLEGSCINAHNLVCETCFALDDPILHLCDISSQHRVIRFESCKARRTKIRLHGTPGWYRGKSNVIESVYVRDGYRKGNLCESVIEATGQTWNNQIRHVDAQGITHAIVTQIGDRHRDNSVEHVESAEPILRPDEYVRRINGAVITTPITP